MFAWMLFTSVNKLLLMLPVSLAAAPSDRDSFSRSLPVPCSIGLVCVERGACFGRHQPTNASAYYLRDPQTLACHASQSRGHRLGLWFRFPLG